MSQTQIELTNHLGFQASLLRLATIPGPNAAQANGQMVQEAMQLEALVDQVLAPVRRY